MQVKVISGQQVQKVKQKNRDIELQHMFLDQIFRKEHEKTLLSKRRNR